MSLKTFMSSKDFSWTTQYSSPCQKKTHTPWPHGESNHTQEQVTRAHTNHPIHWSHRSLSQRPSPPHFEEQSYSYLHLLPRLPNLLSAQLSPGLRNQLLTTMMKLHLHIPLASPSLEFFKRWQKNDRHYYLKIKGWNDRLFEKVMVKITSRPTCIYSQLRRPNRLISNIKSKKIWRSTSRDLLFPSANTNVP